MGEFAEKLEAKPLFFQRAYLGSLLPNYVKSGNLGNYYQTLTDFNFLMAKIQHPDFGVQALIDDFNLVDDSEALTHPEYNSEKAKALNLIQSVLLISADILERDKTQLAVQLLGRLLYFNIPAIQAILEVAKHWKVAPWLRPLTPCLTPPRRGLLRTLEGHSNSVNAVAVTADDKRAISGSYDNTLKVWDLTTGQELFTLEGHSNSVNNAVVIDADGRRAISGSDDNTLKVWDLTTRKELFTLEGHSNSVNAVAITADGTRAISGSWDNTIKVWDLTTRNEQFTLEGHSDSVNAVAVDADGKWAISASKDNTIKVWDLTTRKELFTLKGHSYSVNILAVTADGKRAISGSDDNILKVWDLTTGKEEFTLNGHTSSVNAVAVTADGKRAVSGSDDNTLKVWDLATGNVIASFKGESPIASCAIEPDGVTIVAGDGSGRV